VQARLLVAEETRPVETAVAAAHAAADSAALGAGVWSAARGSLVDTRTAAAPDAVAALAEQFEVRPGAA
jgi:hypothetical protein